MTRKMIGEVDILSTLPEEARSKLASRMTTTYGVEPGQVIIEKGAVGRSSNGPSGPLPYAPLPLGGSRGLLLNA